MKDAPLCVCRCLCFGYGHDFLGNWWQLLLFTTSIFCQLNTDVSVVCCSSEGEKGKDLRQMLLEALILTIKTVLR